MDNINDTIRQIKQELRLAMNGVASTYMRENGVDYKLNFGVELPRLREIAIRFPADHNLAQALWKENIRECKILAGLLQPVDTFFPEIADIWVESMRQPEIAQLTVMNLFARLPYASDKAFRWMADEREMFRLCGFLLVARLLMQNARLNDRSANELMDQAATALHDPSAFIRRAAVAALRKLADTDNDLRKQAESLLPDA